MARDRWDTVGELLERVRDMPAEQRDAFLDEQDTDEVVRAEVRSLLQAEEGAGDFFDALAPAVPSFVADRENRAFAGDARSDPLDLVGKQIRRYEIEAHLGGGGMGIVYKAHDTELERSVALKFLPPYLATSTEAEKRFVREARAASRLDHQNIATIYEIGVTETASRFIAMAYYEGETLKEKLSRERALPIEQAVDYARQIAEGLSRAHEAGIVHRDIKPANVLVTERGVIKVLDFGLARVADRSRLTQSGRRLGTVAYMSPEQAAGKAVDARTDLWALGVLLYEMVTGEHPFDGDREMTILQSIQGEEPIPVRERCPDLPVRLASLIGRCLRKDPTDRPATADHLEETLRGLQQSGDTAAPRRTHVTEFVGRVPSRGMRRLLIGLSSVVMLGLGLWLGWYVFGVPTEWWAAESNTGDSRFGESTGEPALVVLPCNDGNEAADGSAFCTGLMASLSDRLVQLQRTLDVWVVPAAEVKGRGVTTPSDARDWYNADLVLTADTEKEDGVRVRLRLLEGERLDKNRSAPFHVAAANLTVLPKEATRRVADLLGTDLPADAQKEIATGTVVPAAYDAFLQGEGHLWRHREDDHLKAAIAAFKRSVDRDSTYAQAHVGLCKSYWHQYEATKNPESVNRAEHHCTRALAINDKLVSAHAGMGAVLRGTDRYAEAVSAFRRAVKLAPGRADLYDELATTYVKQDRLEKAEATYNTVVYRWPDYWVGYNALGVFYRDHGQFEAAATQFRQAVNVAPNHFRPINNLAVVYSRLGRLEKARAMFERLIELRPNPVAYSNLGTIYFQDGRYADAARAYQNALDLKGDDYRVWGNLADALYWSGARDEAETHYQTAARMAEEKRERGTPTPRLLCHLSGYYAKLNQPEKALSRLHSALDQAPKAPEVLFYAATTNAQLGRHDDALKWVAQALDRGFPPDHVESAVDLRPLRADARFKDMLEEARSTP